MTYPEQDAKYGESLQPDVKGILNLYFSAKSGCFKGIEFVQKYAQKTVDKHVIPVYFQ